MRIPTYTRSRLGRGYRTYAGMTLRESKEAAFEQVGELYRVAHKVVNGEASALDLQRAYEPRKYGLSDYNEGQGTAILDLIFDGSLGLTVTRRMACTEPWLMHWFRFHPLRKGLFLRSSFRPPLNSNAPYYLHHTHYFPTSMLAKYARDFRDAHLVEPTTVNGKLIRKILGSYGPDVKRYEKTLPMADWFSL